MNEISTKQFPINDDKYNRITKEQKLLADIVRKLNDTKNFSKSVNEILSDIGGIVGVNRVYVFENSPDRKYTSNTYEWCAKGTSPQIDNLQNIAYEEFSSWTKILDKEKIIVADDISKLPNELHKILAKQKIKSILILPISTDNKLFGFIGFDCVDNYHNWDQNEILLLQTTSGILSNYYMRQVTELQLTSKKDILKKTLRFSSEFLAERTSNINYSKFTDAIIEISGAEYAAFNLFDVNGREFTSVAMSGINESLLKITSILGFEIINKKWDYDPVRASKIQGKTITYFDSVHDLVGSVLPTKILSLIEKIFHIGKVVVVNIQKNDIPIGDITLLFSTNNSLHNQDIIELFANQIGLLLDRNRSEISLSNSEEKFRTLIEQSPIAIEFYDSTGMLAEVNLACLKLFGIINKKQIEKFALFDDPNISDDHKKSLKHFKPIRYEAIFDFDIVIKNKLYSTTKSGKIWIDTIITPIKSLDEQQSGYLLQIQDITNRKQLEQDLLNSSNRLILATNAAGIGIWDFDVVNNKLVWDEQMYKLYGLTKTQFSGAYESWRAGLHPDDMKRGDDEIQMALRGKKEFNTEFRVLWPDKTIRYIRAIAIVNRDPYGKALRMIGTNWDITKQKQLSEDLINKVNEYAKLNSIMTGRELKMIELKEEIARLKK